MMDNIADMEVEELLQAVSEIGVGAVILGLRQLNISRRRFVDEYPQAEPAVNAALEQIDRLAEPASAAVGALINAMAELVPAEQSDRVKETGDMVATMGPELLRLSGLTRRG